MSAQARAGADGGKGPVNSLKRKTPSSTSSSSDPRLKRPRESAGTAAPPKASSTVPPVKARREKVWDARTLAVQSSEAALSKTGELDVAAYLAARAFEIRALQDGIVKSRHANSQRAFQKVPRALRRRTASHNVRRVPKRLRKRAACEMHEDATPTRRPKRASTRLQHVRLDIARRLRWKNVRLKAKRALRRQAQQQVTAATDASETTAEHGVAAREAELIGLSPSEYFEIAPRVPKLKKNQLACPPRPTSSAVRFARRQRDKVWLPTHIWHAKRAHMTSSTSWSRRRLRKVIRHTSHTNQVLGSKYCTGGVDGALWRFAIPLSPTEKCYRSMHRIIGMRGAVVWDASYFSTIGLEGRLECILAVLQALGLPDGLSGISNKKWLAGQRHWSGWLYETAPHGYAGRPLAPATVVWCAQRPRTAEGLLSTTAATGSNTANTDTAVGDSSSAQPTRARTDRRQAWIRVHPAAFLQLWKQLLTLCGAQRPQVMLEDLRYEIGSIDIMGPGASEALLSALRPTHTQGGADNSCASTWESLSPAVTNPASLPNNAVMAFQVSDPRLRFPPKSISRNRSSLSTKQQEKLMRLLASWPCDQSSEPAALFDRQQRLQAVRHCLSQKAIHRRQAQAGPGQYAEERESDPQIPIMLLVSRTTPSAASPTAMSTVRQNSTLRDLASPTGSFTLLAPRRYIVPLFQYLVSYPLSTGSTPSFGGLHQQRQIAFETGAAWFPGDFPGTRAGWEWGLREDAERKWQWEKRPRGTRCEYATLDLGSLGPDSPSRKGEVGQGWSCDWMRLLNGPVESAAKVLPDATAGDRGLDEVNRDAIAMRGQQTHRLESPNGLHVSLAEPPASLGQLVGLRALTFLDDYLSHMTTGHQSKSGSRPPSDPARHNLATVRFTTINWRGSPSACARIYRLPTTNITLHVKWLQALREQTAAFASRTSMRSVTRGAIGADEVTTGGFQSCDSAGAVHLPVPEEADLIGFITTAGYDLRQGCASAVGCIDTSRLLSSSAAGFRPPNAVPGMAKNQLARVCIIRDAGRSWSRFATWDLL